MWSMTMIQSDGKNDKDKCVFIILGWCLISNIETSRVTWKLVSLECSHYGQNSQKKKNQTEKIESHQEVNLTLHLKGFYSTFHRTYR